MAKPGGVRRYMDDIIVAILCRTPEEVAAATTCTFVTELNTPTVYPPPCYLKMEPHGNQEFLDANVPASTQYEQQGDGGYLACTDCLPTDRGCLPRCLMLLTGECYMGY